MKEAPLDSPPLSLATRPLIRAAARSIKVSDRGRVLKVSDWVRVLKVRFAVADEDERAPLLAEVEHAFAVARSVADRCALLTLAIAALPEAERPVSFGEQILAELASRD